MAVGDSLAAWGAIASVPPASGYATLDVRNGHVVLDFDAAADEVIIFSGVYPAHYASGDLNIDLVWGATSATSGNVKWLTSVENTSLTEMDADGFGSAASTTGAASATNGGLTKTTLSISAANAGDPQAGDAFRIKVIRDADDAADTMAGDAELIAVHLREA